MSWKYAGLNTPHTDLKWALEVALELWLAPDIYKYNNTLT